MTMMAGKICGLKNIVNSKLRCSHKGNFSSSYLTSFLGFLASAPMIAFRTSSETRQFFSRTFASLPRESWPRKKSKKTVCPKES